MSLKDKSCIVGVGVAKLNIPVVRVRPYCA